MIYYLLAVLAVLFWSFNAIVGKDLIHILTPWQLSFFRWFIAFMILIPSTYKDIWAHRRLLWKHKNLIFWQALIGITFSNTFVYIAAHSISAIQMSLIGVTGPMFLIVCSVLFSRLKITRRQKIGFAVAIFGLIYVILKGHLSWEVFDFQTGDLWMLGNAATFGIYSFLNTKNPKAIKQITMLSLVIGLGCLMCVPPFLYSMQKNPIQISQMSPGIIAVLFYMGLCNSVLSYFFWNLAIKKKGAVRIGMLYYLTPVFSTIEAHFILGESLAMAQVYGGILILIGILLTNGHTTHHLTIERA